MIPFLLACCLLLICSALFFYIPRRAGRDTEDIRQANLEWYRLRELELQRDGDESLQADARLRLLEDDAQRAEASPTATQDFPRWLLLPVVAVFAAGLYYFLGSAGDVVIAEQLQRLDEQSSPDEMQALLTRIEQRSQQRPDNLHYLSLLARYRMGRSEYGQAQALYEQLLQSVPEDAQTLAYAAQSAYLAAGRELSDAARLKAEQALAADPNQRTALGLLGMASYEQGQYRAAVEYWERLFALQQAGSAEANMIAEVIGRARQAMDSAGGEAAVQPPQEVAQGRVTVSVTLPDAAVVAPTDTVFILARNAQSASRMPVAVLRRSARDLPLTVSLDDSNSMAGQKLSEQPSVVVAVQVSPSGRPGEANATWAAQSDPLEPGGAAVALELQPR